MTTHPLRTTEIHGGLPIALRVLRERGCGAFVQSGLGCNADAETIVVMGPESSLYFYRTALCGPDPAVPWVAMCCPRHAENPTCDMSPSLQKRQDAERRKFRALKK